MSLTNSEEPPSHLGSHDGQEEWQETPPSAPASDIYSSEPPPGSASGVRSISIEETLSVVKEQVWSFGDAALKSVAEVLVGFGISPTILGYSEEELLEEEEEGEAARLRIRKDEVLSKTSFARRSEVGFSRRRADEPAAGCAEDEEGPAEEGGAAGGGGGLRGYAAEEADDSQAAGDDFEDAAGWDKKDK